MFDLMAYIAIGKHKDDETVLLRDKLNEFTR